MSANIIKVVFLGLTNALGIWAATGLYVTSNWVLLIVLVAGLVLLDIALLKKNAYPLRYLLPGLLAFGLMTFYPIVYNIAIAFSNFSTGHILSKEQVIHHFENVYYQPEGADRFSSQAFRDGDRWLLILRSQTNGNLFLGLDGELIPLDPNDARLLYENGDIIAFNAMTPLAVRDLVANLDVLRSLTFSEGENTVRLASLREYRAEKRRYAYDPGTEKLLNLETQITYVPIQGTFTSADGEMLDPGYRVNVGWENFQRIFQNRQIIGPFWRVFGWTIIFAFFSVTLTFALGLGLAIMLNNPYLKLRTIYRTLLIIPYAIPGFISLLIWAGLFNTNFGLINQFFDFWFQFKIPWFQDGLWAKVAVLFVNLWLGYPYMMIVCLGALQSIPSELYEAAHVDGAKSFQRFWGITIPLLLSSISPLLVGSFALNFNNFNVIFLLTQGGPPVAGAQTPAGATDILISYTYNLAFAMGRGQEFGLAAAISIIIFLIIGTISALQFRMTKKLEDIGENL